MTKNEDNRNFKQQLALAESGDLDAQHSIGLCYLYGTGTHKNVGMATVWLGHAANQGHTGSMLALALEYDDKKSALYDRSKAKALIERAVGLGDVEALCRLALAYKYPHDGELPDLARALELTRQAAESGVWRAQDELGELYLAGKLPGEKEETVLAWLKASGSSKADFIRAQLYEKQGRDGEAHCLLYRAAKHLASYFGTQTSAEREGVLSALHRVQDKLSPENRARWREIALNKDAMSKLN